MKTSVWTDRAAHFTPFPREDPELLETFFEGLPEKYWDRWYGRWFEPTVSSVNGIVKLGNFPWWIPAWMARRMLANCAADFGVSGDVHYHVERTVMVDLEVK